ncbi:MAG: cadherin-like domain-containing protein, partial [Burkholderiaceae bacterium]
MTNRAPVAYKNIIAGTPTTTQVISAAQLLGNDIDPDGDVLRIGSITPSSSGSVVLNADGTITFTRAPGGTGLVTFSYTATDGNLSSNSALVYL